MCVEPDEALADERSPSLASPQSEQTVPRQGAGLRVRMGFGTSRATGADTWPKGNGKSFPVLCLVKFVARIL